MTRIERSLAAPPDHGEQHIGRYRWAICALIFALFALTTLKLR